MKFLRITSLALLGAVWLGYLILGVPVAQWIGTHYQTAVSRVSSGEIQDVACFAVRLFKESAWLLTVAVALAWGHILLAHFVKSGTGRTTRWIFHSATLFVSLNVWVLVASHTGVFWCALFQGFDNSIGEHFGPFHVKQYMLKSSQQTTKMVIMGNSQANRQLKRQLLNELFGSRVFVEDLHWPSSTAYDIMLVHRHIEPSDAQIILCYVSEGNFYGTTSGNSVPNFFCFSDLSDCRDFPLLSYVPIRKISYGLLGDVLPVFRFRDPLAQRILGKGFFGLQQRIVDSKLGLGLDEEARHFSGNMQLDSSSEFQKNAFEQFVKNCAQRNQKLVIVAGQMNPILERVLMPQIRTDMFAFLHRLSQQYPNVTLIENAPFQEISDYTDLCHVNANRREAFTRFMADELIKSGLVPPR